MVKLAVSLSESGFHVLRFDYFGTGDSGGDSTEVSLKGCREDILTAMEEIRDMTEAERVSLIGLRLGATLAAEVAADEPEDIDRLVLWDPVVSGQEYVAALFQAASNMPIGKVEPPARPESRGGGHEICGFPLTDRQREEISRIDLSPLIADLPEETVTFVTQTMPSHEEFRAALGQPDRFESIEDRAAWNEDWPRNAGVVPVEVLKRIGSWMA